MLHQETGIETEPIRMCALFQEKKKKMQLQNVVLKESGQMLLSPVEKAQLRLKTPADPDPTAAERHCSVV